MRNKTTKRVKVSVSLWFSIVIVLAGCATEPLGPADTTKAWFDAIAQLNLARVKELTCTSDIQAVETALASSGGLGSEVDLSELNAQLEVDVSDLTFEQQSAGDEAAVVRVAGNLGGQPIEQEIGLLNEDGVWKVCTSSLPGE
ncbi:MAG TPA: hypothetical protein VJG32_06970 [Anaerolineae bacterium]|nr:hypothetical protein [Anaerolineae bacterium]